MKINLEGTHTHNAVTESAQDLLVHGTKFKPLGSSFIYVAKFFQLLLYFCSGLGRLN